MYKLTIFVLVAIIFSAQAFLFNTNSCSTDADCPNGCCLTSKSTSIFGGHTKKCDKYLLPGAPCYGGDTLTCGCDQSSTCEVVSTSGVAIEAGTMIKGYCKPTNETGPQIAVEGGR